MVVLPIKLTKTKQERERFNYSLEIKFISLVSCGLLLWFLLASFMWALYPDTDLTITANLMIFLRLGTHKIQIFLIMFAFFGLIALTFKSKSEPFLCFAKRVVTQNHVDIYKTPFRLGFGLLSFCLFLCCFSMIKARIPEIIPFKIDVLLADIDRKVFFGKDPWTYFAWVYDYPRLIKSLNSVYNLWIPLVAGSWICAFIGTSKTIKHRFRYILSIMLTWFIGGNIFALLLSSAGPCYYGLVTGQPDIYAEQMKAIRNFGELSFSTYQDWLWDLYQKPGIGFTGISAMPSIHCSTAFLFILMYGRTPIMRVITWAFFLTIYLSSFILAWHYAVDGLLGVVIAYFCWKLAGKISDFISVNRPAFNALATTHHQPAF